MWVKGVPGIREGTLKNIGKSERYQNKKELSKALAVCIFHDMYCRLACVYVIFALLPDIKINFWFAYSFMFKFPGSANQIKALI